MPCTPQPVRSKRAPTPAKRKRITGSPIGENRSLPESHDRPNWRSSPARPPAILNDIAHGSGFPGRPLLAGTGVDREFSGRTGRIGSRNAHTPALVFSNHHRPAAGGYASGFAP